MLSKRTIPAVFLCALGAGLTGCVSTAVFPESGATRDPGDGLAHKHDRTLNREIPLLLKQYDAAGAGVGIIRNGELAWTGYYGQQGPGVPVTSKTVFNTASVAKTVTAETLLALCAKGLISLDDPIHTEVEDPDLSGDPRFRKLTPRLLLSHRAGLLNWPHDYENGRAAFVSEPGESFSYSGMGVEFAAEYAENRLGTDFEDLAFEHLLGPIGVTEMALGRPKPWMTGRLATPMGADGEYFDDTENSGRLSAADYDGGWSGADDLLTTVDAYAQFLIAMIDSDWLGPDARAARTRILTALDGDAVWDCTPDAQVTCADRYGHGLGWMVYRFAEHTVVKHGGNDRGENALVTYSPDTGNGAVIFVNGGNGIFVSTQILGLIGDEPEIAAYYRQLVAKFYGVQLPAVSGS